VISVIVPVYNEEDMVADTIKAIHDELEGFIEHQIVVVNDGSTDRTFEIINNINIKNLSIVNHIENLGYGKSLLDGIVSSKYNCIAIIDGDGSYKPEDIKSLYKYHPQYDMVVGARRGKEYEKGALKRPARKLFNWLAKYATGRKIPDVNSGLRVMKKDIILRYQDSLCSGFSFTTTITLILFLNQYFIKYVPIDYLKRGGSSKVNHYHDTLSAGQIIVEAILHYNPLKLFLLLATSNLVLGFTLGILNHLVLKTTFLEIVSAICISSFVPIFGLGLLGSQLKKL